MRDGKTPNPGWKNLLILIQDGKTSDPSFGMVKRTGSGINIPGQISEGTVGNNFWVKNIKIFVNSVLQIWIRNPVPC
jgi:hypothetical protein